MEAYQTTLKRLLPQLNAVLVALLAPPEPPTRWERICAWWASA